MTETVQVVTREQREKEIEVFHAYQKGVKTREKAKKQEAEQVQAFKIDDFLVSDEIQEIVIEGLGMVRYKMLSAADVHDLMQSRGEKESNYELSVRGLHIMLSKVDPTIPLEKIRRLRPSIQTKLLTSLPFLI